MFSATEVSRISSNQNEEEQGKASVSKADNIGVDKVREMAKAFAAEVPERMLSPAEIQGFLMNWKKRPADAIANAKDWVEGALAADDSLNIM